MTNLTMIGLALVAGAAVVPQGTRGVQLEAADCSRTRTSFGTSQMAQTIRHERIPLSVGTLDVRPDGNGGVLIEPGTGDSYTVTACITAGAESTAEAQQIADAVTLGVSGNRVRVTSPGSGQWGVQLIVQAPRGAQIDVETRNGPIGIRGVEGSITARAANGPISMTDVNASIRAVAANGPISVTGGRGNIDAETQNGPITVNLQGARWEGELSARAKNGPLTLRVPDGFDSGVELRSSRRSPWICRIEACASVNTTTDDEFKTLRLGSGTPTVRLSTVNGPVSLDRARRN